MPYYVFSLNRNIEYKNVQANLGFAGNVVPCTGIIVKDKVRHTLDMHLNLKVESWTNTSDEPFDLTPVKQACGVTTLSWHPIFQTRVIAENLRDGLNIYRGRAGLNFVGIGDAGYLSRSYLPDLSASGPFSASATDLYLADTYFHVDVWGAIYS